eukprot:9908179-Alexandrium_andersonii.AAC.1
MARPGSVYQGRSVGGRRARPGFAACQRLGAERGRGGQATRVPAGAPNSMMARKMRSRARSGAVSYTHLRAHETSAHL